MPHESEENAVSRAPSFQANPLTLGMQAFAAMQAWSRIAGSFGQMSIAATEVIWHRTAMMAQGGLSMPEATKMLMEKPTAFYDAAEKAMVAAARGGDAAAVTAAALRPYRTKTTANARRLRR